MSDVQYWQLKGLNHVCLEDSWVLAVRLALEEPRQSVEFDLEVVLTKDHPGYVEPKEDQQHCYRSGKLVFPDVSGFSWSADKIQRSVDAAGETDFGNIDTLECGEDHYRLTGAWGELRVISSEPFLTLSPLS